MIDETVIPTATGEEAAITTGQDDTLPAAPAAADAPPVSGENDKPVVEQPAAPAEPAKPADPPVEKPAEEEPTIIERPSLAEASRKAAEAREKAEKDDPDDEPEELPAEPAKPEDGKPPEEEPAKADDTDGKPEESKTDDAKPEEIKVEEIDTKHADDSVSARERIKVLAQLRDNLQGELQPLKETIEVLGGQEGVGEILAKVEIMENPAKADEFLKMVEASPNFEDFKSKHFWGELDNPANQQMIIADRFGEDVTLEDIEKLVAFKRQGLIDLDAIEEDPDRLSDDEIAARRAKRAEDATLKNENAALKKQLGDKTAADNTVAEQERWREFGTSYDIDLFPVLAELNVLPLPDDAPDVADAKVRHWGNVIQASQAEYNSHPEFQEIAKMIQAGTTDTVTFRNKVRAFKPVYLDVAKRAVMKELPFLNGTLDVIYRKNGKPTKQVPATPAPTPDTKSTTAAPATNEAKAQEQQTAKPEDRTTDLRDADSRKSAFEKAVAKSAQRAGRS